MEVVEKRRLSPVEAEKYQTCKQVIKDGAFIAFVVGAAAREIKEKQWYLADGYATWEEFCDKEYGWTRRYLDQLIVDVKVINALPASFRKLITSHDAARELAKIPEALRPAVLELATEGGKKPATAAAVRRSGPPPRTSPPPRADKPDAVPSSTPPARNQPVSAPPARKKTEDKPKDGTGLEIPVEILPAWNRAADESKILLTYTSAVKLRIKKAADDSELTFVELNHSDDVAKLEQVFADLSRSKPFAVCPTCQGKLPKDCLFCKGRGFISEYSWKVLVPEETRNLRANALASKSGPPKRTGVVLRSFVLTQTDGTSTWDEELTRKCEDVKVEAVDVIFRFNNSLRPGEKPRRVVSVREIEYAGKLPHNWEKSNLATITKGSGVYDTYKCEGCGITGKRFGLSEHVVRDPKYRSDAFGYCK